MMKKGFTLIEMVLIIAIISIILGVFLTLINPKRQIDKAKDTQRGHDLNQLKTALDVYYNDHNAYPTGTLPAGGTQWSEGSTIYMKTVPADPNGSSYMYQVDSTSTNPQWAVLYSSLSESISSACQLAADCRPTDFGNNGCVVLGAVDCAYVSTHTLP